jgi:predicted porin
MGYYQSVKSNSSGSFQNNIFGAGNVTAEAKGIGASYDAKVAKVMATWQDAKSKGLNMDGKTTQVSALIPFGPGNIMAELADSKFVNATVVKYKENAIGYDYKLSKTVDTYVTMGHTHVSTLGAGDTYGVGVRVRF